MSDPVSHVPLSVLDLAIVLEGVSLGDALRNSIGLAQHIERLGYDRYWVAEHHNMPGIASTGHFAEAHPFASITAVPGLGHEPALWLLGSSTYGAQMAGELGLPYSFTHHFAHENAIAAVDAYHRPFRPSDALDEPHPMLGVSAIVADDEARARYLTKPG